MIRVRFAPSPTGFLHLGNIRTALFNYLFAKGQGGAFILRVEDTDRERSREDFFVSQMEDLRWMGLQWDEGPEAGGEYGPYRQSERMSRYQEAVERLIREEKAYYCYVTESETEEMRRAAETAHRPIHFDNRGRTFSRAEVEARKASGIRPTVRFKIDQPELLLRDLVRGDVKFNLDDMVGDFVIQRADGQPTFHLAVVVDDALMKITHVIRGEDHLSNTPKHILLQRALGYPTPQYGHLSLVHGPNGEPLSKRLSSVSVKEFRKAGYLPEALANYIALLGWAPPDPKHEILPWTDLIKAFDLSRVHKSSANFDPDKLNWVNGEHLRLLHDEAFTARALDFVRSTGPLKYRQDDVMALLPVLKDNVQRLDQIPSRLEVLKDDFDYEEPELFKGEASRAVLKAALEVLPGADSNAEPSYLLFVEGLKSRVPVKGKDLFHPIRMALTGKASGLELKRIFPILGRARIECRLRRALELAAA